MLGCKPNPVNLVGGVVVMVGGATPLMWVVVVTATVGGSTSLLGIAKSGPFAAVAETTNNNTRPIAYIAINRILKLPRFIEFRRFVSFDILKNLRLLMPYFERHKNGHFIRF